MKKIINHRRYDTDSAQFVGSAQWGPASDFAHVEEELYRKRNGEFFLYGSGGPQSKYAVSVGQNEWSGSDQIIPLTMESADEWAQENLSAEQYEGTFGTVSDEGGEVLIGVRISAAAKRLLDLEASRSGDTQAAILDRLINEHLS